MFNTKRLKRIEDLLEGVVHALEAFTPVDTTSLDAVAQRGHQVSEKFQGLIESENEGEKAP